MPVGVVVMAMVNTRTAIFDRGDKYKDLWAFLFFGRIGKLKNHKERRITDNASVVKVRWWCRWYSNAAINTRIRSWYSRGSVEVYLLPQEGKFFVPSTTAAGRKGVENIYCLYQQMMPLFFSFLFCCC